MLYLYEWDIQRWFNETNTLLDIQLACVYQKLEVHQVSLSWYTSTPGVLDSSIFGVPFLLLWFVVFEKPVLQTWQKWLQWRNQVEPFLPSRPTSKDFLLIDFSSARPNFKDSHFSHHLNVTLKYPSLNYAHNQSPAFCHFSWKYSWVFDQNVTDLVKSLQSANFFYWCLYFCMSFKLCPRLKILQGGSYFLGVW